MKRAEKVTAVEDTVTEMVDKSDRLTLLIFYKALYAMGFRIGTVDSEILAELRQWERSDEAKSS